MNWLDQLSRHAHWALRIAILSVFLYHGLDKWGDLAGFAGMMEQPVIMAALVAFLETAGAILVFIYIGRLYDLIEPGNYVIVHVGFALQVIDEMEAKQVFEFLEIMDDLDELRTNQP
jgi:hydrogenase maturation factor